jgi:uncharacterized repeat protein (TIGR03803 family)
MKITILVLAGVLLVSNNIRAALAFQTLYTFPYACPGPSPFARAITLIQGSDGNLYGVRFGGSTDTPSSFQGGSLFRISTSDTLTNLYVFSTNGFGTITNNGVGPTALVSATDGNLYGATWLGGPISIISTNSSNGGSATISGGQGTIFETSTSGKLTSLYSFPGVYTETNTANPSALGISSCINGVQPGGLIQGSDGNLYGVTMALPFWPGVGTGTVFQAATNGNVNTLYSFSGYDGAYPGTLIQGADGNVYGTTFYGGSDYDGSNLYSGEGTVFGIDPSSGDLWTEYDFSEGGGEAPNALLQGIDGNLYGTTAGGGGGGGTIFATTPSSGVIETLYSFGYSTATNGLTPSSLLQGSDENFYGTTVAGGTAGLGTVFELDTNGVLTTLYAFTGGADGASPCVLIQGTDGNLYGATSGLTTSGLTTNGTIFRITLNSGVPTQAPTLAVRHSGNSVIVSWPYPSSVWTLQQNTNVAKTNGWQTSGYTISNNGSTNSITITPPTGNLFFRLMQ